MTDGLAPAGAPQVGQKPSQPFRFLDLPAELRNLVYEFALTSEHGLRGVVVHSGIKATIISGDALAPRVQKLTLHKHYSDHEHLAVEDEEYNQLKYISRQLLIETAGIEVKFNSVKFKNYYKHLDLWLRAMDSFLGFVQVSRPSKIAWFKKVIIDDNYPSIDCPSDYLTVEVHNILELFKFCKAFPKTKVDLVYPLWQYADTHLFIEVGAFISKAFHGIDLDFLVVVKEDGTLGWVLPTLNELFQDIDQKTIQDLHAVKNLKIFPDTEDGMVPWLEDDFKTLTVEFHETNVPQTHFTRVEGGLQTWTMYAEAWYKNGV